MVDRVTVTAKIEQLGIMIDLEMPCRVPIEAFEPNLKESLNQYTEGRLRNWAGLSLRYEGRILDCRSSLADNDIWDGAYVDIVSKE